MRNSNAAHLQAAIAGLFRSWLLLPLLSAAAWMLPLLLLTAAATRMLLLLLLPTGMLLALLLLAAVVQLVLMLLMLLLPAAARMVLMLMLLLMASLLLLPACLVWTLVPVGWLACRPAKCAQRVLGRTVAHCTKPTTSSCGSRGCSSGGEQQKQQRARLPLVCQDAAALSMVLLWVLSTAEAVLLGGLCGMGCLALGQIMLVVLSSQAQQQQQQQERPITAGLHSSGHR
jgi:hypothetical protein